MKISQILKTKAYSTFYKFPIRKTLEIIKAKVKLYKIKFCKIRTQQK